MTEFASVADVLASELSLVRLIGEKSGDPKSLVGVPASRFLDIVSGAVSGVISFSTVALMNADTTRATGTIAYVYLNGASTSDAANGYYQWSGSAWVAAPWMANALIPAVQPYVNAAVLAAEDARVAAGLLDRSYHPSANGYVVVLDPGNLATLFRDIAGTIPASVNKQVGKMLDLSGNDYHWTAYNDASRPYLRRTPDGRYYVEFAAGQWGMTSLFAAVLAQPFTRLSLIRQINWTANGIIFDGGGTGGAEVRLRQQSSSPLLSMDAGTIAILNGDSVIGQDTVVEEYFNGASSSLRQENYTAVVGNAGTNGMARLRIGGIWGGSETSSGNHTNFRFYGVALMSGAQSGADRIANRSFYRRRRSYLATPKIIQCIGHSFPAGTGASTQAQRYVNRLETRLGSGYATVNRGIPTQQSHNCACRMDALPMTVTLTGNAIPASGSVGMVMVSPLATTYSGSGSVAIQAQSGPLANMANASLPVTITATNGTVVEGMMSVAGTQGVYTFTRTASGEPLTVPVGATMHVLQNDRDYDLVILDPFRNNFREVARCLSDAAAMVASLKPGSKFIFHGPTNSRGGTEDTGSAALTDMLALDAGLATAYGANHISIYNWLRDTSASGPYVALGLSSAGDAADIAAGRIGATWLSGDNLHPGNNGHDAISLADFNKAGVLGW